MSRWDGGFYLSIAASGYGAQGGDGEWSYYPLIPLLVRAVAAATGQSPALVAVSVSVVAGAAAMVVLYRLVAATVDVRAARVVTLLTCTWMSAPVLQMTYTEGVGLLLLVVSLTLLVQRWYGPLLLVLPILALGRGVIPAFACVAGARAVVRWRRREGWRAATALAAYAGALSLLWPALVGILSHDPRRYFTVADMWAAHAVARSWLVFLSGWGLVGWVSIAGLVLALGWSPGGESPKRRRSSSGRGSWPTPAWC